MGVLSLFSTLLSERKRERENQEMGTEDEHIFYIHVSYTLHHMGVDMTISYYQTESSFQMIHILHMDRFEIQ